MRQSADPAYAFPVDGGLRVGFGRHILGGRLLADFAALSAAMLVAWGLLFVISIGPATTPSGRSGTQIQQIQRIELLQAIVAALIGGALGVFVLGVYTRLDFKNGSDFFTCPFTRCLVGRGRFVERFASECPAPFRGSVLMPAEEIDLPLLLRYQRAGAAVSICVPALLATAATLLVFDRLSPGLPARLERTIGTTILAGLFVYAVAVLFWVPVLARSGRLSLLGEGAVRVEHRRARLWLSAEQMVDQQDEVVLRRDGEATTLIVGRPGVLGLTPLVYTHPAGDHALLVSAREARAAISVWMR